MNLVVAGTGYVGLVTGICLAYKGNNVACIDIDEDKINCLQKGMIPIYEPGLEEIFMNTRIKGKLNFSTDYVNAYKNADAIFIGVGTPEKHDGSANLKYVYEVCDKIADTVEKDCLIIVKSTVPIGTNDKIEKYILKNLKHKVNIEVASNPEFLSQGTAVKDTINAKRIVFGVKSSRAEMILREIYRKFDLPIVVTDLKSAEMIKYASNDFLALKISFINEIANLCELVGANIEDVAKGMGYDTRIGGKFLKAGVGYGGSCFPKDTKALHWLACDNGYEIKTIKAAIEVNELQRYKLLKLARERFSTLNNIEISVLGATFKPNTDDLRESPAVDNIKKLLLCNAKISVYDPVGGENLKKVFKDDINIASSIDECIKNSELVFIFTEWDEIKNYNIDNYIKYMRTPIIFDGRNCYDLKILKDKRLEYYSIGRQPVINL